MSMTDPIADLFTRIRNGQMVGHEKIDIQNADNFVHRRNHTGFQVLKDGAGIVLKALGVQCIKRGVNGFQEDRLKIEKAGNMGGDDLWGNFGNVPDRDNTDVVSVLSHFFRDLNPARFIFLCNVTRLMPRILAACVMFHAHPSRTSRI